MSNTTTATFTAGQTEAVADTRLLQWAYGQVLRFEGLELPASYQVDFSNTEYCGSSIPAVGNAQGVQIPNELLSTGLTVYAFIWLIDATGGRTQYRVTIPVTPRPAPDVPDPPSPSWTAQVMLALAEAVEKSEEALEKASEVEEEGARQVAAVQEAGTEATAAVGSAQAAAVQTVQTESSTQQAAVQAKGEEVLATIPEDYTALVAEVDDISEAIPRTEVTAGLDSTRYGVTFRRFDANTIETFGTANAARRVLWLNGQDAGMTTSSAFSQTLPAGKYRLEIEAAGVSANVTIQYSYTTFSTFFQIYIASQGRRTIDIEFTAPAMIGIGVSNGSNMGTEENPGRIYFRATQLTAVDQVARAAIKTPDIKIACFGDSITWGRDGSSSSGAQVPTTIPDLLADRLNAVCINYGVGSQGYAATGAGGNAYDNISSKDLSDVDVVLLAYGVNDGYFDLGAADSTDEATIMGQFNKILTYLYTQYPTIRVIVVAPWNGSNVGSAPDYWYGPRSHSAGYVSRKILSDTLKTRCDYYWIPYIEVYDSPINPFTIQAALPDGVHPSAAYYLQIGRWLAAKIGTIL